MWTGIKRFLLDEGRQPSKKDVRKYAEERLRQDVSFGGKVGRFDREVWEKCVLTYVERAALYELLSFDTFVTIDKYDDRTKNQIAAGEVGYLDSLSGGGIRVLCRGFVVYDLGDPVKYVHHDLDMTVFENMRGHHRDVCLCFRCPEFHPNSPDNCPHAQATYEHDIEHGLTTPVWECVHCPLGKKEESCG